MIAKGKTNLSRLRGFPMGVMAAAISAASGQALAQETQQSSAILEEVVVTAQHRAENLQEVPIAVTAISSNTLKNVGIEVSRDLPQMVPSVQFTRSGPSGLFFVRGVGTTNAAAGEEGANAFYVDGVYLGDLSQTVNRFNNIERVEVLKGPQGTLFGRNTTGGMVHIITREPTDDLAISGEVGYANYDTSSAKLYAGGALTDVVKADIAVTAKNQSDGWGRNLTLDREIRLEEYSGARSKLVIDPSESVKLVLAADYFDAEDNIGIGWNLDPDVLGTGGQQGPGDHDTTSNDYSTTDTIAKGMSFTAEVDLGFAAFTSITAYRKSQVDSDFDVDAGPLPLIRIVYSSGSESYQQEFRLASVDTNRFSWQTGVFLYHSKAVNDSTFTGVALAAANPPLDYYVVDAQLDTDSHAIFGEGTYSITDSTELTAGVRYTRDERDFEGYQDLYLFGGGGMLALGQRSDLNYSETTWRLALRHEFTDDLNVYASINRGYKAGSYSLQNPLNDPYKPQYITAYETGLKSEFLDQKLRFNVAVYHYDIDDYQVRSAAVGSNGTSVILNAATVKVDGVDVEFEAAPTPDLRLFGGLTWLDSRFDEFGGPGASIQAPITYAKTPYDYSCLPDTAGAKNPGVISGTTPGGGIATCFGDVSGNETPNAPDFTGSLGATYIIPFGAEGEVRSSLLYSYNDGYYFEADNRARQDNYELINASVEVRPIRNFGVEVWGRNLTNELYAVQKITTGTGVAVSHGAPRTYGITLKYDY